MHLLQLEDDLIVNQNQAPLLKGEYLVEDLNGAQCMVLAGGGKMSPLNHTRFFDANQDWNDRGILIARGGGFGDLLLMTPMLYELKRRWPRCRITFASFPEYNVIFKGLTSPDGGNLVDRTVDYPIFKPDVEGCDAWVFLEKAIENHPRAEKVHMTDLFAEIMGITIEGSKKPLYKVTETETIWALEAYGRTFGKRRCCIQAMTSSFNRNYPMEMMGEVLLGMLRAGFEVFIMGGASEAMKMAKIPRFEGLYNLMSDELTFRQSAAVINGADIVIGGDSSLVHLAGALGIPAIGLFGSFPAHLRTAYCPTTIPLSGKGSCGPCFFHANHARQTRFPAHCPTKAKNECGLLRKIKHEKVVEAAVKHAKAFELVDTTKL